MIGSDLYRPLPDAPAKRHRTMPVRAVGISVCILALGAVSVMAQRSDGNAGEPFAIGTIGLKPAPPVERAAAAEPAAAAPAPVAAAPAIPLGGVAPAATRDVVVENGVTVVRGVSSDASGPLTLKVPEPPRPRTSFRAPDPLLLEASATGPLPRIGRNGLRPSVAYASPPVATQGKPRVAILIGGMGLDREATAQAETMLPGAVTFGFAPYGDEVRRQVEQARAAGHEVVLQVPMEDFGQAASPLPQRLEVDQSANRERLHWLMARFAGYAGLGNYLGGRLLADRGSLKPILEDVAARGLYFVDDGTAARSLTRPLSHDLGLPSLTADIVIDASLDEGSMAAALSRLEALARERGFAFGAAAGRPSTTATIGRFLTEAAKRGIVVVPVSQALSEPRGRGPDLARR